MVASASGQPAGPSRSATAGREFPRTTCRTFSIALPVGKGAGAARLGPWPRDRTQDRRHARRNRRGNSAAARGEIPHQPAGDRPSAHCGTHHGTQLIRHAESFGSRPERTRRAAPIIRGPSLATSSSGDLNSYDYPALRHQAWGTASQSCGAMSLPPGAAVQSQPRPVVGEVAEAVPDLHDLLGQRLDGSGHGPLSRPSGRPASGLPRASDHAFRVQRLGCPDRPGRRPGRPGHGRRCQPAEVARAADVRAVGLMDPRWRSSSRLLTS
jgi:hypothetical protein